VLEAVEVDQVPMIVLGCGPVARSLGVDPEEDLLGEQGFVIKTLPPHIVIAGTQAGGTLYGVHRFMEEFLGVRWYAPGVTRTPKIRNLVLPNIAMNAKPAFLWRHTSYAWPGKDADFLCRVGDNAGSGGPDHPYGRQYAHDGRCHSYFRFVSPGEFFEEHPEYFSEIGGVRQGTETQLCLTNPDVLEIVTERMLERMAKNPEAQQHNFSQMDYYSYCECSRCAELNERYGTQGGTQFWFVNQLAERTSRIYPDKLIGTLAYIYTEEPPKDMVMHPNVAIWLCHMFPSCDSHPIATCPRNADYKRRAVAWSRICSHLYIWHYIVNFAHYYNPFPNFRAMASDMRFYREIGVEGIYLQGMGHAGGGGEFSLLRPYYGMKLLWDPDQDADLIVQDFLQGYYGQAWEPIWKVLNLLHDKVEEDQIHMHLYTNPAMGYLTDEIVLRCEDLFDQAEEMVLGDDEMLERVRVARMPMVYARLFPRNGYKIEGERLVWQGEFASFGELLGFIDRMKRHGFQTLREVSGDPQTLLLMNTFFRTHPEVVILENAHLRVEVVPMLAGRVLRILDVATGECVTSYNVKRCLFFPFAGGLEHRVGENYGFYGWVEPARTTHREDLEIALTSDTFDGWKLDRRIRLEPNARILHVDARLTNPREKAVEGRLRSHLEMNMGDLDSTQVRFSNLAGETVEQDMDGILRKLREGIRYHDQETPKESWTFMGSKGMELTQRLNNEQVDYTWLYAYPEDLGQLEVEIWSKRRVLQPGESLHLGQSLEIRPTKR